MLGQQLNSIKQSAGGDASGFINYLNQTNKDFSEFYKMIQGKTPQQAFADIGLDYNQFSGIV